MVIHVRLTFRMVLYPDSADTPIAGSSISKYCYAALAAIGITEEKRKERNIDFHSLMAFLQFDASRRDW